MNLYCSIVISSREGVVIIFAVIKNFTKGHSDRIWGRFLPVCYNLHKITHKLSSSPAATTFSVLVLGTVLGLSVCHYFPYWGDC